MQILRTYRINGDSLSVWFSPTGAMSTAMLTVNDVTKCVASQLIGLDSVNAVEYLCELGYSSSHDDFCIEVGKILNNALHYKGIAIETVCRCSGGLLISGILESRRLISCPPRLFVVKYDEVSDEFILVDAQDTSRVKEFFACLKNVDSLYRRRV